MAFVKEETEFYKDITDECGRRHKIVFWPAITTTRNIKQSVEFPDNFILKTYEIDAGFNDNLPIGMAKAMTMKFKIDISQMDGDWAEVRNWIMADSSFPAPAATMFSGRKIYAPNIWQSWSDTYDGTIDTWLEFIGGQNIHEPDEMEIDKDYCEWEVNVTSLDRLALENFLFTETSANIDGIWARVDERKYNNQYTPPTNAGHYYRHNMINIYEFYNWLEVKFNIYCCILTREGDTTYNIIRRSQGGNVQFYKQTTDIMNNIGPVAHDAHSLLNDIYLFLFSDDGKKSTQWIINSDETTIGGEVVNGWDFFKRISENNLEIITFRPAFRYGRGLTINRYLWQDLDLTINADEIIFKDKIKVTRKFNIISNAVAHIPVCDNNEDTEINIYNGGAQVDKAWETGMLWTGTPNNITNNENCTEIKPIRGYYYDTGQLWGSDPILERVHEKTKLFISDDPTKFNEFDDSYYLIDRPLADKHFEANMIEFNREIYPYTLDGLVAQTIIDLFGNINQYLVELEIDSDKIQLSHLGSDVTLNLAVILDKPYLAGIGSKGKIVGINKNNITGITNLTIFLRGDKWV